MTLFFSAFNYAILGYSRVIHRILRWPPRSHQLLYTHLLPVSQRLDSLGRDFADVITIPNQLALNRGTILSVPGICRWAWKRLGLLLKKEVQVREGFDVRKILSCWIWRWRGPHSSEHGWPVVFQNGSLLTAKHRDLSSTAIRNWILLRIRIRLEVDSSPEPLD